MGAQNEVSSASPKRVWVVIGASRGIGEEYVAQVCYVQSPALRRMWKPSAHVILRGQVQHAACVRVPHVSTCAAAEQGPDDALERRCSRPHSLPTFSETSHSIAVSTETCGVRVGEEGESVARHSSAALQGLAHTIPRQSAAQGRDMVGHSASIFSVI
jgi:hypothetical protein